MARAAASVVPRALAARLAALAVMLAALAGAAGPAGLAREAAHESLAGRLLVATPELRDPRFGRSVVLMIEHSAGGAFGLVVNRPLGEMPFADLLKRMEMEAEGVEGAIIVHYGGPVEPGRGFLLHSDDVTLETSRAVAEGIAFTRHRRLLRDLAAGKGPAESLFVMGYAGWSPGQLENEMRRGDWFTIPADPALVFAEEPSETWAEARARRRIEL